MSDFKLLQFKHCPSGNAFRENNTKKIFLQKKFKRIDPHKCAKGSPLEQTKGN